jgi:hypothetical protein
MRIVTVVQGGHGPVPQRENTRRYIDSEPTDVDADDAYYARRMMSGELVEYVAPVAAVEAVPQPVPSDAMATKQITTPKPLIEVWTPAEKKEEER